MKTRQKYVKRETVIAVQLSLQTNGFTYRKWGHKQRCKPGDWLVTNTRDTYSVDRDTFARTYRRANRKIPGIYRKVTPIWAEVATQAGDVHTKEGRTHYKRGDYLVYNEYGGGDPYAISKAEFRRMYVRAKKPASRS